MEIRILHRQGKSIRAILEGKSDGQYGPPQPRPTKIDAHKDYLQ